MAGRRDIVSFDICQFCHGKFKAPPRKSDIARWRTNRGDPKPAKRRWRKDASRDKGNFFGTNTRVRVRNHPREANAPTPAFRHVVNHSRQRNHSRARIMPIVIAISVAWFSRVKRDGRFISAATSCYFFEAEPSDRPAVGTGENPPTLLFPPTGAARPINRLSFNDSNLVGWRKGGVFSLPLFPSLSLSLSFSFS